MKILSGLFFGLLLVSSCQYSPAPKITSLGVLDQNEASTWSDFTIELTHIGDKPGYILVWSDKDDRRFEFRTTKLSELDSKIQSFPKKHENVLITYPKVMVADKGLMAAESPDFCSKLQSSLAQRGYKKVYIVASLCRGDMLMEIVKLTADMIIHAPKR